MAILKEATQMRDRGDSFRDAGAWVDAVNAYGSYLKTRPDDFNIWVQKGNCAKEARLYDIAQDAYNQAIALDGADADVHLQLGHLEKLRGKKAAAAASYNAALKLQPKLADAKRELKHLGVKIKTTNAPLLSDALRDKPATFVDVSDLMAFLQVHSRVTGIQRVQSCIVQEMFRATKFEGEEYFVGDVVFVYCDQNQQKFYAIENGAFQELIDAALGSVSDQGSLVDTLDGIRNTALKVEPRKNDIYIILGAFWIGNDYSASLLRLKSRGVRTGVYIYDLIPITHSQYVTESTRQDVIDKFGDVMSLMDFALTISDFVATEVKQVLNDELGRDIPILSVPLAHELPEAKEGDGEDLSDEFINAVPEKFALCVCTLEGRKNHLLLLNIWSALARKHKAALPTLLLVGKWGWRAEEFRAQLVTSKYVDGKIAVMGNISDRELKYLYEKCRFTVFPSFVEGWGLPVGESLAHGKPCIASRTSSIPEVGGDFCRYFDPYDLLGATQLIEQALFDDKDVDEWSRHVRENFVPRTWKDVAMRFFASVGEAVAHVPREAKSAVTLAAGELYLLNTNAIYSDAGAASWRLRALKFVMANGWWPVEHWGAWSSARRSVLAFGTNAAPGSKIRMLLYIQIPPPSDNGNVRLQDSHGGTKMLSLVSHTARWQQFETVVGADGAVHISVERVGEIDQLDVNIPRFVGIRAVGFYAEDDLLARVKLVEAIVLNS